MGSPWIVHSPSSSRSTASLARLPAASTARTSSSSTGSSSVVAVDEQLTLRPVAAAGDVDLARGGDDLLDRHLVLGQRAGLVRADHRRRAQRLDRRQLLDDRPLARHALHAEREHDRQDRRQPLRDRGDGQRDADEQHVDEVGCRLDVGREQDRGYDHDGDRDHGDARACARCGSTSRCSGVRSSSVRPSRRATLPISVAMPVAVTTARPRPA